MIVQDIRSPSATSPSCRALCDIPTSAVEDLEIFSDIIINVDNSLFERYEKMYADKINRIISLYKENNIKVKKGLSDKQIKLAQEYYNVVFPQDFEELLATIRPVQSFYDWSDFSKKNVALLNEKLAWPVEGALFDVENNNFWLKSWGEKPSEIEERLLTAKNHMEMVPKLIPVMGHRYISSEPNEVGNPIYSVYQMDIIFYGENIWDYFEIEFEKKKHSDIAYSKMKKYHFGMI